MAAELPLRPGRVLAVPREFALALAALGITLTLTVVPAPFIVDDLNYLVNVVALEQGHVAVSNTRDLTPSAELAYFDPAIETRTVTSTPVGSTAPPLYGLLALPFAWLGWRGLVAINTLSYLATAWMVFVFTRRYVRDELSPWLAAAAFALGGFTIEYAQGLWPHSLSVALCTAGILLAALSVEYRAPLWLAPAAGFLLSLATGVRYQNALILVVAGAAILRWSDRRWRAATAYGAAALPPLAISAVINHARLGWWNPISKGPDYLNIPVVGPGGAWLDPVILFWSRLVDFSWRPPLVGDRFTWVSYDPVSGAHLMFGITPQKAFLQSAPWALVAVLCFAFVWFGRSKSAAAYRPPVRLFSLVALALLFVFSASGRWRHEGAAYNQRYLLELVPLAAITFGWALSECRLRVPTLVAGALGGGLLAVLLLVAVPPGPARLIALFKTPLVLAAILGASWWSARRHPPFALLSVAVGACLGWACLLHLGDDLVASRVIRNIRLERTRLLRQVLPDRSALLAYWGNHNAAAPLLLEKDIVILDAHADEGKDAPTLVRELLARGRRVFVITDSFSGGMLPAILERGALSSTIVNEAVSELRPSR